MQRTQCTSTLPFANFLVFSGPFKRNTFWKFPGSPHCLRKLRFLKKWLMRLQIFDDHDPKQSRKIFHECQYMYVLLCNYQRLKRREFVVLWIPLFEICIKLVWQLTIFLPYLVVKLLYSLQYDIAVQNCLINGGWVGSTVWFLIHPIICA